MIGILLFFNLVPNYLFKMIGTRLFHDFFNSERAGGLVLICCTICSLVITNVFPAYHEFWHLQVAGHTLVHWINDGLMAIFFLLIGLELEREVYIGELSDWRRALLPILAAVGGMLVPAVIYTTFNSGENVRGFGVPMATDIAFAIGVLSLLGNRVPLALKIFLTALAVIDDLGAILVIAIFYTADIDWMSLGIAIGIFGVLLILNRLKIYRLLPYLILGVAMWYFMLHSGVHATISGVLLAFAIPFGNGEPNSISYKLQHFLHRPVSFIILPVFALANTSIILTQEFYLGLTSTISLGIILGLVVGKPLGIFVFSYLAVKLKWSTLSDDMRWPFIFGAGLLGGIGFTMSIFISLLGFSNDLTIDESKIAVMLASVVAGILGYTYLYRALRNSNVVAKEN
jgi:Na+:H+ antiporter, NhaA family